MATAIRHFISDEHGTTAVEYGLIASLVVVSAIVSIQEMGSAFSEMFLAAGSEMSVQKTP